MTRKTHQWQRWTKLPLAVAVAAGMSGHAAAYSFYVGDVEAQFNTTLSAGAGWRVEDRDKRLIAQGNLGPEYAQVAPLPILVPLRTTMTTATSTSRVAILTPRSSRVTVNFT